MILGRVTSEIVATVKDEALVGHRILAVVPIDLAGAPSGPGVLAVDRVDAGVGDTVLVNREGGGARILLGSDRTPVQAVIVAIVEGTHVERSA